ncbi:MAG: hypothetical protein J0H57_20770 [Rhodospirillales bacterium]|nr:hypothetical protein [Rhodospirillales bacterium]
MDGDDRGLLEATLHRLQIMRQESEQQTALLRQLCQAVDSVGLEIGRLSTAIETGGKRGRKPAAPQAALASLSAQAALARDLLTRAQSYQPNGINGSGKPAGT